MFILQAYTVYCPLSGMPYSVAAIMKLVRTVHTYAIIRIDFLKARLVCMFIVVMGIS